MSETAVAPVVKEKEALFSKKNRKLITDPLNDDNPITVQVLGVCSALAVTSGMKNALVMSLCVVFVNAMANVVISLLRNGIPGKIRMIVQLVVIAALVSAVELFLKRFSFDMYKELAIFISLIITNCIIMGRLEAFAMANKPWPSFLDGIGNGLGYGGILIVVAFFRELFGFGTLFGKPILAEGGLFGLGDWLASIGYQNNGIMVLPAASIFLIGIFIWIQRARNKKLIDIS